MVEKLCLPNIFVKAGKNLVTIDLKKKKDHI